MSIKTDPELLAELERIAVEASPGDSFMVQLQRACSADYAKRIRAGLPPLGSDATRKAGVGTRAPESTVPPAL
jgi:hypothetical protein